MLNRPSLAEALFKNKKPFKPYDRNPLGLATANQINALREYIEELETENVQLRSEHASTGARDRPTTDSEGGGADIPCGPENGEPLGA